MTAPGPAAPEHVRDRTAEQVPLAVGTPPAPSAPLFRRHAERWAGSVAGALGRPAVAVPLALLGVLLMALVAASAPNDHTLPVRLPLSVLPAMSPAVSTRVISAAIAAQALGLVGMLTALRRGWRPGVRQLFAAGVGAVLMCTSLTPTGSGDVASYAAYGRLAALGADPYRATPADLGGGYAPLVSPSWLHTPSVYGPVATWLQEAAGSLSGDRPWLTVWLLMLANGAAFLATGLLLIRVAGDGRRAAVLWAANPLLIGVLVAGGHLDTFVAGLSVAAVVCARRAGAWRWDVAAGVLIGLACGIKVSAGLVAAGLTVVLLTRRAWGPALRQGATGLATLALLYACYGLHALAPLHAASGLVSVPSLWLFFQDLGNPLVGAATTQAVTAVAWPVVTLGLAWALRGRLPRAAPQVVAVPLLLTLAWMLAAPWTMPWYSAVSWACASLLPRSRLLGLLLAATAFLALMHNTNGRGWAW
ncbi:putative hexosyltransferase [Streptacidiphilus rugosus]|uniref:hypothetical protein n=1 Tax=Streptacidiphilus rugosus TaxID=405783 RepID=UPI00055DD8A6|nr:hypothetical protein [Streptacidiphilus rugosus]